MWNSSGTRILSKLPSCYFKTQRLIKSLEWFPELSRSFRKFLKCTGCPGHIEREGEDEEEKERDYLFANPVLNLKTKIYKQLKINLDQVQTDGKILFFI